MTSKRPTPPNDTKMCTSCGRQMDWRPAWERCWDTVRYCSDACRKHRYDFKDHALEAAILDLLKVRAGHTTICPSEASRIYFGEETGLLASSMERTRCAARRLVGKKSIEILQKGRVVDPSFARGPIRLKLK